MLFSRVHPDAPRVHPDAPPQTKKIEIELTNKIEQ